MENELSNQGAIKSEKKLEGFGGWLLLFGFGIFLSTYSSLMELIALFNSSGSNVLTIINSIWFLLALWLLYLMVKRKRVFKKWFLGVGIASIVLSGLDAFSLTAEASYYVVFIRTVLYVVVWSLYLWKSKRAKDTFVN